MAKFLKREIETAEDIRQSKSVKKVSVIQSAEQTDASRTKFIDDLSHSIDMPGMLPDTNETDVSENTEKPHNTVNEIASEYVNDGEASDMRVSAFGLGPFPAVPPDYPRSVFWNNPLYSIENPLIPANRHKDLEIISRVLLKLWKEGERNIFGGTIENDKVYPLYRNTAYVSYTERTLPDGNVFRYISRIKGRQEVKDAVRTVQHPDFSNIFFKTLPDNMRILEIDSTGINPYEYLGL